MPIYEYACPDCGHEFELMQKFSDDPTKLCPTCGKENVKKLISRTSFVLSGGGWYSDHYGLKSGEAPKADAPKADAPKPAESAPAAAPAPAPAPKTTP